jgi:phosphoribosylformylglycinamidine (FGAM) synthase-like enzyme
MALAEMSLSSNLGLKIDKPKKLSNLMEYYFGEDQGRYLIEIEKNQLNKVKKILKENNIFNEIVATVQKDYFEVDGKMKIKINDLYKTNNKWYHNY